MNNMNKGRLILGGLAAGFVLMLGEIVLEVIAGGVHVKWLQDLGLPLPGEGAMALLTVMAFGIGVLIVWLYAAIQPRYGPGPKTAIIAGLVVWVLNCLVPNVAIMVFGALSAELFWLATLHQLVVVPLAALAGARLYRERAGDSISPVASATITH